jgi:phosphate starvation-inducible PhoH-like protein
LAAEKRIKLHGINPLDFYGLQDQNLRTLESMLDVQIMGRGRELVLRGEEEKLAKAEHLIAELLYMIHQQGPLTPEDIESVVRLEKWKESKDDSVESEPSTLDSIILFTKKGPIEPKTEGQKKYFESTQKNDIVVSIGPAGTGKTYMAVAIAVAKLRDHEVDRIILCRPAVEAGESLGFLPGDFREKVDPYVRPLYDALYDMVPLDKLRRQIETRIIEIVPLAYMRGRTLNNAFVILDEAQNTTTAQMKMFLTRLGTNSRSIITGDITQMDLPPNTVSGLVQIQQILKGIDGIDFIYLSKRDVIRHPLVRKIIKAYEEHDKLSQKKSSEEKVF